MSTTDTQFCNSDHIQQRKRRRLQGKKDCNYRTWDKEDWRLSDHCTTMALLHFRLEGDYPDKGELPTPNIIKESIRKYVDNENSTAHNIHSLASDIVFNLRRDHGHFRWLNDISNVCSFYGPDKQDCIKNLQLRDQYYETGIYYCFAIVILNGNFFALEFKCVSEDYFTDSDSIYREIDI